MKTPTEINKIDFSTIKVNDLVVDNYRISEIFQKYGIDFCCHGNRPLGEALAEKQVSREVFVNEYNSLISSGSSEGSGVEEGGMDQLIEHIINTHHSYVKSAVPRILEYLDKIVKVHGPKYSYLAEIKSSFSTVGNEMLQHMMKEENVLFPLIRYLLESEKFNERPKTRGYGSIRNPINAMEQEHVSAGELVGRIRLLSNNFTLPADACNTFSITYKELEQFEKDLFKHVHLENNILFPKAIKLEEELNKNHK